MGLKGPKASQVRRVLKAHLDFKVSWGHRAHAALKARQVHKVPKGLKAPLARKGRQGFQDLEES